MKENKKELNEINIPKHIAIIMDGNGRWAKKRNLPVGLGHKEGMVALKKILTFCGEIGVDYLTVYAFSTENWKRSKEEVGGIFNLLVTYVRKEIKNLMKNNVKVNILGDIKPLPMLAYKSCLDVVSKTQDNTGINFNIALNYGSREEIKKACQALAEKTLNGEIGAEEIDDCLISRELYTGKYNIPDPELIIRTSGEERLSNFLLWQGAYSELVFVDTLWPDFDERELEKTIVEFNNRHRRFGGR